MSEDLIKEKFDNHEERISKLEDVTSTLQTMDYRLGTVEKTTSSIDDKLDKVLNEPVVEKGRKWDKFIDYIFYFILATLLGFIVLKLGMK